MKMYKQPITEITAVDTEHMMQDMSVSFGSSTTPPPAGMPKRGDVIN